MTSGKLLPAAWALLPGKSTAVYEQMWTVILLKVGEVARPTHLIIDMELACLNAFTAVFGADVNVRFCFFHLRKARREQAGQRHILAEFMESEPLQEMYKLILALAFVPIQDVETVFENFIGPVYNRHLDNEAFSEDAIDYLSYLETTYLGQVDRRGKRRAPRIKLENWSQYESVMNDIPMTSSAAESFNSNWNTGSSSNPTIWPTLEHMKSEDGVAHAKWREALTTLSQVQHNTIQYSTVQHSTVQYSTVQYSTLKYSTGARAC